MLFSEFNYTAFSPKMTAIEQPCYTIMNLCLDSEPYNEMQLKMDLGMLLFTRLSKFNNF